MSGSYKRPNGRNGGARLPGCGNGELDPFEVDMTPPPMTHDELRRYHQPFGFQDFASDKSGMTPEPYDPMPDIERFMRDRNKLETAAAEPQIEQRGARGFVDKLSIGTRKNSPHFYIFDGKRPIRSTYSSDPAVAAHVLETERRQRLARIAGIENWGTVTVIEVIEDALQTRDLGDAGTDRSEAVFREFLADIERLEPYIERLTLRDITPAWATATYRSLMKGGPGRMPFSPSTAFWTLSALKAAIRGFAEPRGLAIPPLFKLKRPKGSRNGLLTADDWNRIQMALAGCVWCWDVSAWRTVQVIDPVTGEIRTELYRETDRMARRHLAMMHRFVSIALFTGTRHQAILDLRWRQSSITGWVDTERGILHRAGVAVRGSGIKRVEPVLMPGPLTDMMRIWRDEDRRTGAEAPVHQIRTGKSFGKPYKTLRCEDWHDLMDRAGITSSINPHSLKKTLTSLLINEHVPIVGIADLLSTSPQTLLAHYNAVDTTATQGPAAMAIARVMGREQPIPFHDVTPGKRSKAFTPKAIEDARRSRRGRRPSRAPEDRTGFGPAVH